MTALSYTVVIGERRRFTGVVPAILQLWELEHLAGRLVPSTERRHRRPAAGQVA